MGWGLHVDVHDLLRAGVNVGRGILGSILADVEVGGEVAEDHVVEAFEGEGAVVDGFGEVATPEPAVGHDEVETGVSGGDT